MSIKFKPSWAKGMDDEMFIEPHVNSIAQPMTVKIAIDHTLAAICYESNSTTEAVTHIGHVVTELNKVRENMVQTFNSDFKDDH